MKKFKMRAQLIYPNATSISRLCERSVADNCFIV